MTELQKKLVEAFNENGNTKTIKIKLTQEDLKRREEVSRFLKQLKNFHEISKESKLQFP